jgi:hypothetical protein
MPRADEPMGRPAWYERDSSAWPTETVDLGCGGVSDDDELAVILRRAAQLGIPGWRVLTALGLPLRTECAD